MKPLRYYFEDFGCKPTRTKMSRNLSRLSPVVRLEGIVEHGFGRGSKTLGFPTANLNSETSPSLREFLGSQACHDGIYMGWVSLPSHQEPYRAAVSVGTNPSFEDSTIRLLEAHLIDYKGPDFYNASVRILLCAFIRESYKFESMDELITAIQADCDFATHWFTHDDTLFNLNHDQFLRNSN